MRLQIKPKISVIGCGFIGQSLIRVLLSKGYSVNVLDRNACPAEFHSKLNWIVGSFNDKAALNSALEGAEVAYHLVASTVPGDSHVDIATELAENVIGTLNFIEICLSAGVKRIVFSSSSSVYGPQDVLPISETQPTNPISAHGIHKLMIEKYLLLASYKNGIDVRILRIANPYGPGQNIYGRQGFIAMTIGNLLRGLPVLLSDDGRVIRDFIYIDDVAEILSLCGTMNNLPSVINVGSQKGFSLKEVISLISELLQVEVLTQSMKSRAVDIPSSILDIHLMNETTRFSPMVSLADGLSKTLRHHGFNVSCADTLGNK